MLTEPQNEDLSRQNFLLLSYRTLVWFSFFVLSVTGLYNLFVRGYSWYDLIGAEFWRGYFGETLAVKLILFCGVLTGQALAHFYIGKLSADNKHHTTDKILSLKQRLRLVLYFTLALGLGVLFCAIMLVRGRPW